MNEPKCPKCNSNNIMRISEATAVEAWDGKEWNLLTIENLYQSRFMCQACLYHFDP